MNRILSFEQVCRHFVYNLQQEIYSVLRRQIASENTRFDISGIRSPKLSRDGEIVFRQRHGYGC